MERRINVKNIINFAHTPQTISQKKLNLDARKPTFIKIGRKKINCKLQICDISLKILSLISYENIKKHFGNVVSKKGDGFKVVDCNGKSYRMKYLDKSPYLVKFLIIAFYYLKKDKVAKKMELKMPGNEDVFFV
jgi:hypothetical protein